MTFGCTFTTDGALNGGAIEFSGSGTISDSFFNNHQTSAISMQQGSLQVSGCSFSNNSNSSGGGGAACTTGNGNLAFTNCSFSGNTAVNGGAIDIPTTSTLSITSCTFYSNVATNSGGAIHTEADSRVSNCTFNANNATQGGAILNEGPLTSSMCIFDANNANVGGAIYNNPTGQIDIHCSRFVGNTANTGGSAIYNGGSSNSVNAINNWWGTNTPNASTLFTSDVTYVPYGHESFRIRTTLPIVC